MNQRTKDWKSRFVQPTTRSGGRSVRRRFRLPAIRWTPVLITTIVLVVSWIAFGSHTFRVTAITIEGSLNPSVAAAIQSLKGKNTLLLSTQSLELSLPKQQSSLKSIQIVKGLPDTLKISVVVREPRFIWKTGDTKYYLDDDGIAFTFEDTNTTFDDHGLLVVNDSRSLPVVKGTQIVPQRFVSAIRYLNDSFQSKTGLKITGLSVPETTREIDISTDANVAVKLDTTREIAPQLTSLVLVLAKYRSSIHQYVDLRVEGRAFYQ